MVRLVDVMAVVIATCATACAGLEGLSSGDAGTGDSGGAGDATIDAAHGDGAVGGQNDAAGDAANDSVSPGSDAGSDAPAGDVTWNDIEMSSNWTSVDAVDFAPGALPFQGVVFDGHYAYFVPGPPIAGKPASSLVVRYDTRSPFGVQASWMNFDLATLPLAPKGMSGGAFDGRFIYFAPANNPTPHGVAVRYDTQAPFSSSTSWQTFDLTGVDPGATGFSAASFDGKAIHFIPNNNGAPSGLIVRFDHTWNASAPPDPALFQNATGYTAYDLKNMQQRGFSGGVFDGRYLNLVPQNNGGFDGLLVRIDTSVPFGSTQTFDLGVVDPNARGYVGGVFDGKNVYLAPGAHDSGFGPPQIPVRFSTSNSSALGFNSTFNVPGSVVSPGLAAGAVWDGRFVYFVGSYFNEVYRVDTTADFTQSSSWSGNAPPYFGFCGIFDGEYAYFIAGTTVSRFHSRTPAGMPAFPQMSCP